MTVEGPALHPGQKRAVDLIKGKAKYITVVAPRQTGKTFLALQCLLYWGINEPGSTIFFCSPTYQQAKKPLEELYNAIANSGIVKAYNKSDFRLDLRNGTTIHFKSTERPDNLRGFTGTHMIVDEAAYHGEEVWSSVLKPIMLVKGKKVLFISTPRGNNWFKRMYDMGLDPENTTYGSCRMRYSENPYLDLKELQEAKKTLPDHIFKAEYEGDFTDSETTVFGDWSRWTFPIWPAKPTGRVYCGIDLGRANDWTVATFIDSTGTVIDIYRDNQKEWSHMINEIMTRIKKHNAIVLIEVNSIGDVIYEMVKSRHFDTHPFVTTNKSKNDAIEGLAVDLAAGSIRIPSGELFPPLDFELSVFEYEYSPKSRTIKYSAALGFHDDTVISLALANTCLKQYKTSGKYSVGSVKIQ